MKALAELALASNSNLYRGSAEATPDRLMLATEEASLVVAKNVAYRAADLRPKTLSDLTPYYEWDYQSNGGVEDPFPSFDQEIPHHSTFSKNRHITDVCSDVIDSVTLCNVLPDNPLQVWLAGS
jgi:hypothetical protein